jgi:hypothetical protein
MRFIRQIWRFHDDDRVFDLLFLTLFLAAFGYQAYMTPEGFRFFDVMLLIIGMFVWSRYSYRLRNLENRLTGFETALRNEPNDLAGNQP